MTKKLYHALKCCGAWHLTQDGDEYVCGCGKHRQAKRRGRPILKETKQARMIGGQVIQTSGYTVVGFEKE